MTTNAKTTWMMEADYLQGCNCDYGCPCEFEAPPTRGDCQGLGAWRINRGKYGDLSLDGLGFGFVAHWPGAMHKGNGTAALLFDEKANAAQRKALFEIATGSAGGMPFEIIAMTLSKLLDPQYLPFQFKIDGRESSLKVGNVFELAFEPIKNPVTGQPETIRVAHETGFLFQTAECVSTRTCRSSLGELAFSWPNQAGFVSRVKYSN